MIGGSGRGRRARAAAAPQDLMDSGVRPADLDGDPAGAPAGPAAQLADLLLLRGRHAGRRAMRTAGTLLKARQRRALGRGGLSPAAHPLPHRRLRDVRPGGRLGERLTVLNDTTNDVIATARRQARSMVGTPGLLEGVALTPTPSRQARTYLTPFRTSLGTSASASDEVRASLLQRGRCSLPCGSHRHEHDVAAPGVRFARGGGCGGR